MPSLHVPTGTSPFSLGKVMGLPSDVSEQRATSPGTQVQVWPLAALPSSATPEQS